MLYKLNLPKIIISVWINDTLNFCLKQKALKYSRIAGYLSTLPSSCFNHLSKISGKDAIVLSVSLHVSPALNYQHPHNSVLTFLMHFRMLGRAAVCAALMYANPFCMQLLTYFHIQDYGKPFLCHSDVC